MNKLHMLHILTLGLFFSLIFLQSQAEALALYSGDYIMPDMVNHPEWGMCNFDVLDTYNNVTIATSGTGGGVGIDHFDMYNNSTLTTCNSEDVIYNLNLYNNAAASLYEAAYIQSIFVNSASTALIKLYAEELGHNDTGGLWNNGMVGIRWLDKEPGWMMTINLRGTDTYSHIQFVPEPATLAMIGIGILALRRRK